MPKINPIILTWARETAGFSLEAASEAIGLNAARGVQGADRLHALEQGEGEPSRPLLLRMVQKYRRPLLAFYLNSPPAKADRGEDFRTVQGRHPPFDPQLDALLRDVRGRQILVKSLLEDDEIPTLNFIGSHRMSDGSVAVARSIQEVTGFSLGKFRAKATCDEAFKYLRSVLEGSGIFVLLMGNLGNYQSNISARSFRGFAIADPVAPFIVVNDQDARAAWSFTVLHEAAHLWLGTSGISGASAEIQIERFCNDVAGRMLVPADELQQLKNISSEESFTDIIAQISEFADERNVSRRMIAYMLLQTDLIDGSLWQALTEKFHADYLASKAVEKKGEVSYYIVRRHRLGPALVSLVGRAIAEGVLTYTKAGRVLGVKPRGVGPLLRGESVGSVL